MKKLLFTPILLFYLGMNAQNNQELLDVKMQLLDSKLELLDTKLQLIDNNPKLLDNKISQLDSMIKQTTLTYKNTSDKITQEFKPFKSSIKLNPERLLEGTFLISYERAFSDRLSIDISAMGTYVTTQGIGSGYFKSQRLEFFDIAKNKYSGYFGEMMSGFGATIQVKNYLHPRVNHSQKAPIGLYAGPMFFYRRALITGSYFEYIDNVSVEKKITQKLDVYSSGVILGKQFIVADVLCVDIYAGGMLRLSHYKNETGLTRYKSWKNIDYSGVLPTAGISIGILK